MTNKEYYDKKRQEIIKEADRKILALCNQHSIVDDIAVAVLRCFSYDTAIDVFGTTLNVHIGKKDDDNIDVSIEV